MIEEFEVLQQEIPETKTLRIVVWVFGTLAIAGFIFLSIILLVSRAPAEFPENSTITIDPGESVNQIVSLFADSNYVRSADLLYIFLLLEHDSKDIQAGTYAFTEPISTRLVAKTITEIGPFEPLLSITFPEGISVVQFAQIAGKQLTNFSTETFISYATDFEGKLFPDTYFVPETFTDEELFDLLLLTFEEKLIPLFTKIEAHSLDRDEVLVLASIIEREANTKESKGLVASVLLNRLNIGMPLQADASIEYILDKPLSELTPEDLKIDSPYNTYLYNGLPPTPIGNPGLDAIEAVLNPTDSEYFYYITDNDGVFHFAETLRQHNANIARFLR